MTDPRGEANSEYQHVPAAFINAIAEEGTKAEAVEWLQKTWNERCYVVSELRKLRDDMEHAAHNHAADLTFAASASAPSATANARAVADALKLVLDDWANANSIGDDAREDAEAALNAFYAATLPEAPQPATQRSEATELAEQWKGRADDAGRLSRAVLVAPLSETGWIKCSERMPEKNTWNLVCYEGGRMPIGNMSHWFDGERFRNLSAWHVTHWMPLPAAPSPDGNNGSAT